jgi:hypothetical protein
MPQEPQAIEVEVVAIDGVAPPVAVEAAPETPRPPWRDMQSRVLRLDSRWWPLWVLFGAVALVLLLTVGLVVGVVYLILRILQRVINAFIR